MKKFLTLSLLLLLFAEAVSAQTRKISGKILDEKTGSPLIGASIMERGTNHGTTTDANGLFSLNISTKGKITLIISNTGYLDKSVIVGNSDKISVSLTPQIDQLGEVVVVGYGTQKRKDLTGSIQTVSSEDIVRTNPTNPIQALQGQAAGVDITKTSNIPGQAYSLNVRGLGSINYSNAPLVVIDGIMGGDLNTLNPSDIASMEVLKDASALAIYGSRGANGVIIVTTKKGAEGKPKFGYDMYVGDKVPSHLPKMATAQQFYKTNTTDRVASGLSAQSFTPTEDSLVNAGGSTNWPALITGPVVQTSQVISVSGGSKNTHYYGSGGFLSQPGCVMGENYKKYTADVNVDSKINKVLKIGFSSVYAYANQNEGSFEALRSAYRARPTGVEYYNQDNNPSATGDINFNGYAVWMGINDHQVLNPLVEAYPGNQIELVKTTSLLSNGYVELTPVKGLSIKSSLSTSVFDTRTGDYRGTYTKSQKASNPPKATYNTANSLFLTLDNILTYNRSIGKHSFTFTGLQSAYKETNETYSMSVENLPFSSDWYNLGSAGTIDGVTSNYTQRTLLSYMGRLNYSFNDEYLLTLTGRWDGASVLAPGHQWSFFPSAAFAWRLIQVPFIKNINAFSNLKLRLSYGEVGNDVVPPYSTQANLMSTAYSFGGTGATAQAPQQIANSLLSWEKSKEYNIGLDIGLLQNRITANIDVYRRQTSNLILNEQIPISTGFSNVTANLGEVLNRGLEVTLNTVNIQTNNLRWTTSFNFSTNHNEITKLYGGITENIGNKLFVGKPVQANYDYKFDGIWQLADSTKAGSYGAQPGYVKAEDLNHDGSITSTDDREYLGSPLPKWLLGITSNLAYKNWNFSFTIYTRQGVQYANNMLGGATFGQVNGGRYNYLAALDYWTPNNPSNTYFGLKGGGPAASAIVYQNASFWRVSDITLGYVIPQKVQARWGLSNLRVYGQVSNPFVFTHFLNFDPESNSSSYIDDVPSSIYTLGLSLSF